MDLKAEFAEIISRLREGRPVVHHITNYVTAECCADIALAAGASPVMADEPEEIEEFTCGADALVLNLGTFSFNRMVAMEKACEVAKTEKIPVILDPVGVMTSSLRLDFALKLLEEGYISIVRGNRSECEALLNGLAGGRGIDHLEEQDARQEAAVALKVAKECGSKFNCVFVITGTVDNISNGKQALVLNNGHPMLKEITGSGCMTSTLIGCCAAVTDNMMAAASLGVVIMGQSAEVAANFLDKKDGPGMFKARLMDCVYHVTTKWNLVNLNPEKMS